MEKEIKFDLSELFELEEKNGRTFDYLRFTVSDIHCIPRSVIVPRKHVEKGLVEGIGNFFGRMISNTMGTPIVVSEMVEMKRGNIVCVPCKGTLHNCSWASNKLRASGLDCAIGQVMCEAKWPKHYMGGILMEGCSRFVLRKQLQMLKDMGFEAMSSYEVEFSLFNKADSTLATKLKSASYLKFISEFEDYLITIEKHCAKANIDISALRLESYRAQFELVMNSAFGMKTFDDVVTMREAIKEISSSMQYNACFMNHPTSELDCNSQHYNFSLWTTTGDAGRINVFYDAEQPRNISKIFRHFVAGLLKHAKALLAICSPTVNCYRNQESYSIFKSIDWGFDDRKAAFRVKVDGPDKTYVETRIISSACNTYLAAAAIFVAGNDGIKKQLPLQNERVDNETKEYFPSSLKDALEELKKDEVLKKGLGEQVVRWFVSIKESEIEYVGSSGLEKEKELYFEYI